MFLRTLEEDIANFTKNSSQNFVDELNMLRIWDPPLVGVAGASDPLWKKMKEPQVIGPDHLTPEEWLPGAKSVISYFLPFTEHIRNSNRLDGKPSTEWLYGRYEGEMFNNSLRRLIIGLVEADGGTAVAPAIDKRFVMTANQSNWSERHVAFIAGLGTFGLSRSLITPLGTAGRYGSVIVDWELEAKPRPYNVFDDFCSKCGKCIERCPCGAITEEGKDNESCSQYLFSIYELNKPRYACGKCQTAVPCEYKMP